MMLRIISGDLRGRKIKTPEGPDVRPTSDRVRLAIFNTLKGFTSLQGCSFLDVFCGTGALGFEALSQGAQRCIFVDSSPASLALTKENATHLGVSDRCTFVHNDASQLDVRPESFSPCGVAFLDPPYYKDLVSPCIKALIAGKWLKKGAILVIETEKEAYIPLIFGKTLSEKNYGITKVTFLTLLD